MVKRRAIKIVGKRAKHREKEEGSYQNNKKTNLDYPIDQGD